MYSYKRSPLFSPFDGLTADGAFPCLYDFIRCIALAATVAFTGLSGGFDFGQTIADAVGRAGTNDLLVHVPYHTGVLQDADIHLAGSYTQADFSAWFKKCHFQVTPEIDRALIVKGVSAGAKIPH
jgi:hypothetical protein